MMSQVKNDNFVTNINDSWYLEHLKTHILKKNNDFFTFKKCELIGHMQILFLSV